MLLALTACKSSVKSSELEVKLNGVTVSALSTVEMLGSDFSVNLNTDTIGYIFYREQPIALVALDENSAESDISKRKILELSGKGVSVNGITVGSSKSDVKKSIGSPTEKHNIEEVGMEIWYYSDDGRADDENYLMITFDKNGQVHFFDVAFEWF